MKIYRVSINACHLGVTKVKAPSDARFLTPQVSHDGFSVDIWYCFDDMSSDSQDVLWEFKTLLTGNYYRRDDLVGYEYLNSLRLINGIVYHVFLKTGV